MIVNRIEKHIIRHTKAKLFKKEGRNNEIETYERT